MLASAQPHAKCRASAPFCCLLASRPFWQRSWEVDAACRNKLHNLNSLLLCQAVSSSSKSISASTMWVRSSWWQLWRRGYHNVLPLPTYFHLGLSQFGSLCVLHCKRSCGHRRGKLDPRRFLQLVNTSLGFVNWGLMPVTCSCMAVKCAAF